jgi:hypothetical protein
MTGGSPLDDPDWVADATRRLLRKYELILAMRAARASDGVVAPKALLASLSRQFPGALLELNAMPPNELMRRIAELRLTHTRGYPLPLWAACTIRYHDELRAILDAQLREPNAKPRKASPSATALQRVATGLRVSVEQARLWVGRRP